MDILEFDFLKLDILKQEILAHASNVTTTMAFIALLIEATAHL